MIFDVAIIGAGVVGGLVARELMRYDISAIMLEKCADVGEGASSANSGIAHAGFDAPPNSAKAKFNVLGSRMMEKVCADLGVKYKKNGSIVLAKKEDEMPVLSRLIEQGKINGTATGKLCDKAALMAMEPSLCDDVLAGVYFVDGGILCPYGLTVASSGNAMDNGCALKLKFEVKSADFSNNFYTIYSSNNESVFARAVVNCAGVFADNIDEIFGVKNGVKIHARRGEYVVLDKACSGFVSHTIFRAPTKMGKGVLVTPTVDGNILAGPTSEDIFDKTDKATTAEGLEKVLAEVALSVKNFPIKSVITSFSGLRAVSSGGDFNVRRAEVERGKMYLAEGIESPGLTASPAIAEYLASMIAADFGRGKRTGFIEKRRPFDWFKRLSNIEKNEIISREPSFGKVVCRCEGVTAGEILYALKANPAPRTLDGVKRRARAGMGRCQGGFCTPMVMELLANELNLPLEKITKSGEGSNLLIDMSEGGEKCGK